MWKEREQKISPKNKLENEVEIKKIKLDEEKHVWAELETEMALFPRYCINESYIKRLLA